MGPTKHEEEGHEQMDYAVDRELIFDTAELYSIPPKAETQGSTETIIGTWFKKNKNRDKIILATKVAVEAVWIGLEEERLDLIKKI